MTPLFWTLAILLIVLLLIAAKLAYSGNQMAKDYAKDWEEKQHGRVD